MNIKYNLGCDLLDIVDSIIKDTTNNVTKVTALEPPFIQVTRGPHISQVKLGKFIRTFRPLFTDSVVKRIVEEYKELNGDISQYKVKYQTNYVEVYKTELFALDSTSKSCMTNEECVDVYDYDERLKIMVIYKNSQIVGRTLVRVDREEYVRLYVDHNHLKTHIANAIIDKEGFTKGDLEGIKLKYIEKYDEIVCPYLDGIQGVTIVDDEYLLISRHGELTADSTNGFIDSHVCSCESCGDSMDEDYSIWVDDRMMCEDCVNQNYTYIESHDGYVHNDYVVRCIDDDDYYHEEDGEIVKCEDGEYHLVENVVGIDDCYYHKDECEELVSGDYALKDDAIESTDNFDHVSGGFYLREELEIIIEEIETEITNIQTDLFNEDKEQDLNDEIAYINELLAV